MTGLTFSYALAQQLYFSEEQFPVDFEQAWAWLGYSKKDKALSILKKHFVEGEDFALLRGGEWSQGGRSSDLYVLTTSCFKELGMMAGTAKGKEVRKYFVQCERQLKESVAQKQSSQLLPEERLQIGMNALQFFGIDQTNPRLTQGLQDWCLNLMLNQKQLMPAEDKWLGVAERAEELGYGRIGADLSLRTRLGQAIAKLQLDRQREKRLCNGTQREIWVYRICDELDAAIRLFFQVESAMSK